MTVWLWLWIGWGVAFCVIEGVALANSTRGDTLSEHVWAWIGVRPKAPKCTCWDGHAYGTVRAVGVAIEPDPLCPIHGKPEHRASTPRVTPKWTLRVARLVVIFGLVWLVLHFTTGGWV
jgi:hypothetical protein